ncbi:MAG: hypothetical protein JW940_32780 [Polyangiaceae bacterium]|nr:hypothetical protein [Polyangiaceae bacterium]
MVERTASLWNRYYDKGEVSIESLDDNHAINKITRCPVPRLHLTGFPSKRAMIDEQTAIDIARARAADNGWAFSEPLAVLHRHGWFGRPGRFEIETNANNRGTKARFVIDEATGAVLSEGYLPR